MSNDYPLTIEEQILVALQRIARALEEINEKMRSK